MAITPLPPAPLPSDTPSEFNEKAFDLVAALEDFVTETNATAVAVDADAATATTQAGISTTQAGIATTQAGIATTQAGIATTQADDAADSAVEAANLVEKYQGALASDPTLDKTGGALSAGDFYVNTTSGLIRAYTGSAWVNSVNVTAGVSGFSAGTTGLTPSTNTQGDITLSGTLAASNGGTGLTSPGAAGNVLISNGTAWTSGSGQLPPTQQIFNFGTPLTGTFAKGANFTGTYTRTSPSATVTVTAANTLAAGDRVYLDYTTGTAIDGWQTVISATGANFTVTSSATTTTSGNVTVGRPIVITVNNHGLSTGNTIYVSFSVSYVSNTLTVFQATTNTFQIESGLATQNTLGTVTLPQITVQQTWTKPTGCKAIFVELCGGGGQFNFVCCGVSEFGAGSGYSRELIDVTSVSTASVIVGYPGKNQGGGSTGYAAGTTSFGGYLSATGGSFGVTAGVGLNGTLNINGSTGTAALSGNSFLGRGGPTGLNPSGFGSGSTTNSGNNATAGVVFITEYY